MSRLERPTRDAAVNRHRLAYVDRLGDLLLILARAVNSDSDKEPRLWRPPPNVLARAAQYILCNPSAPRPASA